MSKSRIFEGSPFAGEIWTREGIRDADAQAYEACEYCGGEGGSREICDAGDGKYTDLSVRKLPNGRTVSMYRRLGCGGGGVEVWENHLDIDDAVVALAHFTGLPVSEVRVVTGYKVAKKKKTA